MNEIDRTNLIDLTKFQLDEISKIENYFIEEINQRKSCSKKLSKYVAGFDYIDKILIVLSTTSGGVSIIEYEHCWSTSSNSECKFYFNFFFNNRNSQKIIKHNKKQEEKAW